MGPLISGPNRNGPITSTSPPSSPASPVQHSLQRDLLRRRPRPPVTAIPFDLGAKFLPGRTSPWLFVLSKPGNSRQRISAISPSTSPFSRLSEWLINQKRIPADWRKRLALIRTSISKEFAKILRDVDPVFSTR